MQLVRLMRDGEVVRMSKRTGKTISLSDLLDEIPVDACRYFFNAKPDTQMEFDLGLAVRWALAHGYRKFVIAGALGGRLDQTIASFQTLRGLTDAGAQGWLIGCGWVVTAVQNGTLTFPAGMEGTVSVFSSGDAARGVTLRGLLYEITDAELRCAMPLGVSNSFTGAAATVRVTDGTVFVLWQGNALPDGLEVRHGAD